MNDLFCSVNEGVLFWIAGYTADQKHVTRYVALVLNNIEAEKLFTKHNIIL